MLTRNNWIDPSTYPFPQTFDRQRLQSFGIASVEHRRLTHNQWLRHCTIHRVTLRVLCRALVSDHLYWSASCWILNICKYIKKQHTHTRTSTAQTHTYKQTQEEKKKIKIKEQLLKFDLIRWIAIKSLLHLWKPSKKNNLWAQNKIT